MKLTIGRKPFRSSFHTTASPWDMQSLSAWTSEIHGLNWVRNHLRYADSTWIFAKIGKTLHKILVSQVFRRICKDFARIFLGFEQPYDALFLRYIIKTHIVTMEYESSFRKNFNLLYTMKDAAMKSGGWWEKRASCCDAHAPYSIINESEKSHSISTVTVSRYRI